MPFASHSLPFLLRRPCRLPRAVATKSLVCALAAVAPLSLLLPAGAQGSVSVWLSTADQTHLLAPQPALPWRNNPANPGSAALSAAGSSPASQITVDDAQTFQTMEGFGHALTGGSAELLMRMSPAARHALLVELFGSGPHDVHTTYLRLTVGASDMNDHVYTYDDIPAGATDPTLAHFSLGEDEQAVIPVLHEILAIQPSLKLLASAWTAPAWMKTNDAVKGGTLRPEFYGTYARYWVMYLEAMRKRGFTITTLTPQNEPENSNNTPSLLLTADEEARFIGHDLGPALQAAHIATKILAFDHNCDHPQYPETVLRDPAAGPYTAGSAFHLYYGKASAMTEVHDAFPSKGIYFTEQTVIPEHGAPDGKGPNGKGPLDLSIARPVARLIVGAPENWSRTVLLWNLAADAQNGPHTANGGCPVCTGALTLEGDDIARLPAYYALAHVSKFVPPGSVRVASGAQGSELAHVAFRTPAGGHVLIVSNTGTAAQTFALEAGRRAATATLPAQSVATYTW